MNADTHRAASAVANACATASLWTEELLKHNNYGWALKSARVVDQLAITLKRLTDEEPSSSFRGRQ